MDIQLKGASRKENLLSSAATCLKSYIKNLKYIFQGCCHLCNFKSKVYEININGFGLNISFGRYHLF